MWDRVHVERVHRRLSFLRNNLGSFCTAYREWQEYVDSESITAETKGFAIGPSGYPDVHLPVTDERRGMLDRNSEEEIAACAQRLRGVCIRVVHRASRAAIGLGAALSDSSLTPAEKEL